jgi:pyrimidine operon attenuation protein/uracil phosphoribosyltransferase
MKMNTDPAKTIILTKNQISQRINRIAYQVYEDNLNEQEIIVAGIAKSGYIFASKIAEAIKKISPLKIQLIEMIVEKHSSSGKEIKLPVDEKQLKDKVIILVDDVLNSGKTLMLSLRPFLKADVKKIRIAVLVNRNHPQYPVAPDFTGMSLATTLQEHVTVDFENGDEIAYMS